MWAKLMPLFGAFSSAVLTAIDADGYPASVRTALAPDESRQVIGVTGAEQVELRAGPASLLLHSHNEQLWDLQIVLLRGVLEPDGAGWIFRPLAIAVGADEGGLAVLRMLQGCRRTASAYLRKRNLPRPLVPWAKLKAIKSVQQ